MLRGCMVFKTMLKHESARLGLQVEIFGLRDAATTNCSQNWISCDSRLYFVSALFAHINLGEVAPSCPPPVIGRSVSCRNVRFVRVVRALRGGETKQRAQQVAIWHA